MLNNVKKKVRAVIHSETKQAVLEVRKSYDKKLEKAISENVKDYIRTEQQAQEARMKKALRAEMNDFMKKSAGGGRIFGICSL